MSLWHMCWSMLEMGKVDKTNDGVEESLIL